MTYEPRRLLTESGMGPRIICAKLIRTGFTVAIDAEADAPEGYAETRTLTVAWWGFHSGGPAVFAGTLRNSSLADLWTSSELFEGIRRRTDDRVGRCGSDAYEEDPRVRPWDGREGRRGMLPQERPRPGDRRRARADPSADADAEDVRLKPTGRDCPLRSWPFPLRQPSMSGTPRRSGR